MTQYRNTGGPHGFRRRIRIFRQGSWMENRVALKGDIVEGLTEEEEDSLPEKFEVVRASAPSLPPVEESSPPPEEEEDEEDDEEEEEEFEDDDFEDDEEEDDFEDDDFDEEEDEELDVDAYATGGGWYRFPDGSKVQGRDEAIEHLRSLGGSD